MTRYYFHLHECGTVFRDEEGQECHDAVDAVKRARQEARAVMAAEVLEGRLCLSCHIELVDPDSAEATIVRFSNALSITGLDHTG